MATIEARPFRPPTVRSLEIRYDCDLTRQGGDVIPLGVLVDLSVVGMYTLGLVGRTTLSTSEVDRIGALVRADFASPFAYLHGIFNSVIRSEAPWDEFANLAERHTHSLRFQPLDDVEVKVPRPIIKASAEARRLWARDEVLSRGNQGYSRMFSEEVPDDVDKRVEEETRELKKIAA
jgi:hypothetical protein